MTKRLKRYFFNILSPVIAGFLIARWAHNMHQPRIIPEEVSIILAPVLFVLSAVFAIAGPILYRSIFAYRLRNLCDVSLQMLQQFERNLIGFALVTPYLALIAYVIQLPRFHLAAILLMALYAIYYTYPSSKRIDLDRKIFRAD